MRWYNNNIQESLKKIFSLEAINFEETTWAYGIPDYSTFEFDGMELFVVSLHDAHFVIIEYQLDAISYCIYTMSPQNHEKQRFWPPKNQVIYSTIN